MRGCMLGIYNPLELWTGHGNWMEQGGFGWIEQDGLGRARARRSIEHMRAPIDTKLTLRPQ